MKAVGGQKTIFISIYDGDTEKNVLRSDIFNLLKASGHRLVLLIRGADRVPYYEEQFGGENVVIELLPKANSRAEELWYFIGWNTLPTFGSRFRRHMGKRNGASAAKVWIGRALWVLGHLRAWREFLRFVYARIPDVYAADLFEKYHPDLVYSPNMFSPEDFRLLKEAKRRGVKTITSAKSWDVLTNKAFTRVKADHLLVFNEYNREEGIAIGDYPSGRVTVTGYPQFDRYADPAIYETREAFMRRIGADPATRLILFAIPGDWKTPYTHEVVTELDKRIAEGRFGPVTVLARFHPKYPDATEKLSPKHFIFDRPGTKFSAKQEFGIDAGTSTFAWTFTGSDIAHLANSLKHSEMVINVDSTITLDAAVVDTPAVLIGYDGNRSLPYWDSIISIYDREHYRHVVDTGAAPLVKSHDELEEAIKRFLADPEYLRAQRNELMRNLLYRTDGKSSERTAAAVLAMLTD